MPSAPAYLPRRALPRPNLRQRLAERRAIVRERRLRAALVELAAELDDMSRRAGGERSLIGLAYAEMADRARLTLQERR